MARNSAIDFQKFNRNLFDGKSSTEGCAKLMSEEMLIDIGEYLDELEIFVQEAKEGIDASKAVVEELRDIISSAETKAEAAYTCLVAVERKIKDFKSGIGKMAFSKFESNSSNDKVSKGASLNETLDRNISNNILDTVRNYEGEVDLRNNKAMKSRKYQDIPVIVEPNKEKSNSKCKYDKGHGSKVSSENSNKSDWECSSPSMSYESNTSYVDLQTFSFSEYCSDSIETKRFNSEFYKSKTDQKEPPCTKLSSSNKCLIDYGTKKFGELYICDEEAFPNIKSCQPYNKHETDNCKLDQSGQTLQISSKVTEVPYCEISDLIPALEKVKTNSKDCLIPKFSSDDDANTLKENKDFKNIQTKFLSENEEKLSSILTSINDLSLNTKPVDIECGKYNCNAAYDSEEIVNIFPASEDDSVVCLHKLCSNIPTKDYNFSNDKAPKQIKCSESVIETALNAQASCEESCDVSIDTISSNAVSKSILSPIERISLETAARKLISLASGFSDKSQLKDDSYMKINASSPDPPKRINNSSETLSTTDTSVHDDSSDSSSIEDNGTSYTSDSLSDSDTSLTESTSSSNASFLDSSENENHSCLYQIYTTDSSMNGDLTKSLLSDLSISQNDNLSYLSFKEGVSSASLNNSHEEDTSKFPVKGSPRIKEGSECGATIRTESKSNSD